jgi:hypothetical protein
MQHQQVPINMHALFSRRRSVTFTFSKQASERVARLSDASLAGIQVNDISRH